MSLTPFFSSLLVGDSIMKTGTGNGETGPWGMGYELIPLFDPTRIHVYNQGLGGRSSRGYIEEGARAAVLNRLQPSDYVLLMFGHNNAANSQNYADRKTLPGIGEETAELESPVTHKQETIHTCGWYLRQYVQDTKAKGATPIVCSPVARNTWIEGRIKRLRWLRTVGRRRGAYERRGFSGPQHFAANRYGLGEEKAASYFNDNQHTTKAGARLNPEAVVEGIRGLNNCPLANFLDHPSAVR